MSSILGIDYGSKRVGVAIAHRGVSIASPLLTLANNSSIFDELKDLAFKEKAQRFVVGLPRNLNSDDTDQTRIVREFAVELEAYVGLPVTLQDEAATTVAVGPSDKASVDARAASLILRDYLEETERASSPTT